MSDNNFTPGKKQKQISPAVDNYIFYAKQQPCAIANVIAKYGAVIFGESPNTEHRTQKKRTINALYSRLSRDMGLLFLGKTPDTGHRTRKTVKDKIHLLRHIFKVSSTKPPILVSEMGTPDKVPDITQTDKRFLQESGWNIKTTKAVFYV